MSVPSYRSDSNWATDITGFDAQISKRSDWFTQCDQRHKPKLKPRWDVHLSGDDDQLGYAGESLSSVLGE